MQLWVGLGNPGAEHAGQRHHVGFMAVDAIAAEWRFASWKSRHRGLVAEGRVGDARVLLLKPATFMNDTGRSVGEATRFYKLDLGAVTAFHDELDLAPFKVKVKVGGGAAGHNGLRSMDQHIGQAYRRVRIGIGHPGHKDRVLGHVLANYAKAEVEPLAHLLGVIGAEAKWLAAGDDVRFMNDIAMRMG